MKFLTYCMLSIFFANLPAPSAAIPIVKRNTVAAPVHSEAANRGGLLSGLLDALAPVIDIVDGLLEPVGDLLDDLPIISEILEPIIADPDEDEDNNNKGALTKATITQEQKDKVVAGMVDLMTKLSKPTKDNTARLRSPAMQTNVAKVKTDIARMFSAFEPVIPDLSDMVEGSLVDHNLSAEESDTLALFGIHI